MSNEQHSGINNRCRHGQQINFSHSSTSKKIWRNENIKHRSNNVQFNEHSTFNIPHKYRKTVEIPSFGRSHQIDPSVNCIDMHRYIWYNLLASLSYTSIQNTRCTMYVLSEWFSNELSLMSVLIWFSFFDFDVDIGLFVWQLYSFPSSQF